MYLVINKWVTAVKVSDFSGNYLRNRSTLDIGVLGYIGIVWPKEQSPEVSHIPPVTPCIMGLSNNPIYRKRGTEEETVHILRVRSWPRLDIHIWIPSFWTLRILGYWVWGAIWNFATGTGLLQLSTHKGPVLRPWCIGPGRARTQHYSILWHRAHL